MATTQKGICYPSDYSAKADIPADMKAMAESIDKIFENGSTDIPEGNMVYKGSWQAGIKYPVGSVVYEAGQYWMSIDGEQTSRYPTNNSDYWKVLVGTNSGGTGENGKSAYELAVENGFEGTVEEWLASLQGKDGTNGTNGVDGQDGADGIGISNAEINSSKELVLTFTDNTTKNLGVVVGSDGKDGTNGIDGYDGSDGKSAYQIWLDEGNTGTEAEFLTSLKGQDGTMTFEDLTDEQKATLKGEKGDTGETGDSGVYLGSEEPTDSNVKVWVDPNGETEEVATKGYVDTVISIAISGALGGSY